MKPLMLLRPEPGFGVSAETAREMGMEVIGGPLFSIEPVAWDPPESDAFDGLLIGSANALRHGGEALERYARLPVHVVGEATADAVRAAGMLVGQIGRGGLQSLLDRLAGRTLRLLRLAGEDRVALTAPEGITLETRTVYHAVPEEVADAEKLRTDAVVALHSGAAATRFASEIDRLGIDRSPIAIAAIGPRVAEMVGSGWQSVHIAKAPDDAQLLALARSLCQDSA
ncbi:uroporphyrinogen-III synthase [Qipengyuania sp. XHP0207]|uniref:uroporphyrinogen-III synthase n=1 Tax=Qipengyuania sp. XHP0207 TaxID=3038078 RepID=UPI00241D3C38|nr:uroporphyrinogen-III synthase [Qipengyuania sp. XHP0207]MDG5746973.1 uroporphyrinogen-III synthase [Qipengyuania sp. XHP0207]